MAKRITEQEPCLWERQQGESEQAFKAFSIYLQQEKRSLRDVSQELHKSLTLISRWSVRWFWQDRIRAFDNERQREELEKAKKKRHKMFENQANLGVKLQKFASDALDQISLADASLKDVRELIKIGAELERLARNAQIKEEEKNAVSEQSDDVVVIVPDDGLNNEGGGSNGDD